MSTSSGNSSCINFQSNPVNTAHSNSPPDDNAIITYGQAKALIAAEFNSFKSFVIQQSESNSEIKESAQILSVKTPRALTDQPDTLIGACLEEETIPQKLPNIFNVFSKEAAAILEVWDHQSLEPVNVQGRDVVPCQVYRAINSRQSATAAARMAMSLFFSDSEMANSSRTGQRLCAGSVVKPPLNPIRLETMTGIFSLFQI